MLVEGPHVVYWNIPVEQALPLVQAAARGSRRVLRIQRQQHDFIALRRLELRDGFAGKRMPVAHGYETASVQTLIRELGFERPRLALGEAPDGRASANGCV